MPIGRLIAIGDIHGRYSKLVGLIEKISPRKEDTVIFLGDYIDRRPDSYHVVEFLIKLKEEYPNIITLRGNHEDFVISLFMGNQSTYERNIWLTMNGGNLTMASYRKAGYYLKEHQDFYMSLPVFWETEEYFFCHAGVRPGIPLDKQSPRDILQIREPFLSSLVNHGKIIVHGHEPVINPTILPNRINIDTGTACYGSLTAIELSSLTIWQQI